MSRETSSPAGPDATQAAIEAAADQQVENLRGIRKYPSLVRRFAFNDALMAASRAVAVAALLATTDLQRHRLCCLEQALAKGSYGDVEALLEFLNGGAR